MKVIILLRGLPGSGKSTFASSYASMADGIHLEADMFFVDKETNEYKFDPSKLKVAHEWCQKQVEYFMRYDGGPIIVSNTFTQEWEMQPYFDIAEKYNYTVHSLISENRHSGASLHGVPEVTIDKMKERFEIKL